MKPTHRLENGDLCAFVKIKFTVERFDILQAIRYLIMSDDVVNKKTIIEQIRSHFRFNGSNELHQIIEDEWIRYKGYCIEEKTKSTAKKYFPNWFPKTKT